MDGIALSPRFSIFDTASVWLGADSKTRKPVPPTPPPQTPAMLQVPLPYGQGAPLLLERCEVHVFFDPSPLSSFYLPPLRP